MSLDITLTDKQGNTISYDTNSMLSEVTHYGYINITYQKNFQYLVAKINYNNTYERKYLL